MKLFISAEYVPNEQFPNGHVIRLMIGDGEWWLTAHDAATVTAQLLEAIKVPVAEQLAAAEVALARANLLADPAAHTRGKGAEDAG